MKYYFIMEKGVTSRYDVIAKKYQNSLQSHRFYDSITAKFCNKVRGKILDAGCGNGYITSYLTKINSNVIGIDISDGMLSEAQKQYPKIKFQKMNMTKLSFEDNTFGGIFCFQAFEHISPEQQLLVLKEFFRALQNEGTLMFNTNNLYYPPRFLFAAKNKILYPKAKFGEIKIGGATKTYRYLSSFRELKKKIEKAGFTITSYENKPFSKWIQIWAKKS